MAILSLSGCDDASFTGNPPASAASTLRIDARSVHAEPLEMGGLRDVVLDVVWALQDGEVRRAIAAGLRDPDNLGPGIDLRDCRRGSVASLIAEARIRRDGQRKACGDLASRDLILYMDERKLDHWDTGTIPIVTAVPDITQRTPEHLMGYRSPLMLVDLGVNRNIGGPVLVIAATTHRSRIRGRR